MIIKSLPQFYQSQKWRDFRRAIIAQRMNREDGVVYSEYSGQPINNDYDIVLHHIKPLTLENVNDYTVALNPDNIQIVTPQEHNEIHARFGYNTERKVYYVYGAPLSGKTRFVQSAKGNSDIIVDFDSIWEALTGERYYKPNALKQNAFELRRALYDQIKTRYPRQGWERAWVIEGGARRADRERRMQELGAEPIFIQATEAECLARLEADPERRKVKDKWRQYIKDWFRDYEE